MQNTGILSAAPPAILDQEFVIDPYLPALAIIETQSAAQTFTVGMTGTLTRVDLQVLRDAKQSASPLVLEIRRTLVGGFPDENITGRLAHLPITATLPPYIIAPPNLIQVELGVQSLPVSAGDVLSISLNSMATRSEWYLWAGAWAPGSVGDMYDRGQGYFRSAFTGGVYRPMNGDLGFRTFVVPIPEPSSLVCSLVAAAAMLGTLRSSWRMRSQ